MSLFQFKLACVESELETSKRELADITKMYIEAEESRKRNMVRLRPQLLVKVSTAFKPSPQLINKCGYVGYFTRSSSVHLLSSGQHRFCSVGHIRCTMGRGGGRRRLSVKVELLFGILAGSVLAS